MAVKTNITINIVEPGSDVPVPDTGLFTHGIGNAEASIIATVAIVIVIAIAAIILCLRKKKINLKPSKHSSIILSILAIITSIATFTGLTFNSIYNHTNAKEGDLAVMAEDTNLTIEVGDEPVLAVLPVDITVEEATAAGYTLTAYTDNTDLVSTTDDTNIIPMISTDEGELAALKDNTYGLSLSLVKPTSKDEVVYTSLSTVADNPTFITDKDYKATEANNTTTIYYGFYITPDTPYGTYTGSDIYYNATTNSSKVIFHGNGLYFNNNPEQTTNNVEYLVGVTENTHKYSHTPNINDEGEANDNVPFGTQVNEVISIPGATNLRIKYSYRGGYFSNYGGYLGGYGSFWQGAHPDYSPNNNYTTGVQNCGSGDVEDGRYYSDYNSDLTTVECAIPGDTVTFGFWSQGGGPGSYASPYGYYTIVTGYDENGNIIYLNGNTPKKGEYKEPAQDLPYIFKGWSEDKKATAATYKSKNDIELNLPLTMGKTTELYAIWQHATKIHFDGNGSTGGEMPDKLLAAGEGTSLCNNYTRIGYAFNNWNTEPDGSGDSYSQCYWYTAPADQSVELNLYAQWTPATTIIYDGNGGEGNQQQQNIRAGETQSIWGNWGYFSKDGYIFSHWNTKPDGSGETYYEGDQFTAPDQSTTITLYAQWARPTIITFNGNGSDGGSGLEDRYLAPGEGTSFCNYDNYTRTGYYFLGWNTESDGSGTFYGNCAWYQAPSDESETITLYAQWVDCMPYNICYNLNGADGETLTYDQGASPYSDVTLFPSNLSYTGHGFAGWSEDAEAAAKLTDSDTSNDPVVYGPNQIITTGDLSAKGMTLYAVWMSPAEDKDSDTLTFQTEDLLNIQLTDVEGDTLANKSIGYVTALLDSRDNNVYAVAKLADGNYWMIENLRLGNTAEITTTNTNNPFTINGKVALKNNDGNFTNHLSPSNNIEWCSDYRSADCLNQSYMNNENVINAVSMGNGYGNTYSYGNYYNWYSATAGQGTYEKGSGDTAGDICPAGWMLPRSGKGTEENGSFVRLDIALGNTGEIQGKEAADKWRSFPYNYIKSGWWFQTFITNRGHYNGLYWSSTADGKTHAYAFDIYGHGSGDENVSPASQLEKSNGLSVRCVAPLGVSVVFDGNDADSGEMVKQYFSPNETAPLYLNEYSRNDYFFAGWNTEADGSGDSYFDGANFTASNETRTITLYAQWEVIGMTVNDLNYMQDFATLSQRDKASVIASMVEGRQYNLEDGRDGKVYFISKLANRDVWMTQNLDHDIGDIEGGTYTSNDTDIKADWIPIGTESTWGYSYTAPRSYDPGVKYWNGILMHNQANCEEYGGTWESWEWCTDAKPISSLGDSHYHLGNYYNWTAAVAMSGSNSYTTQNNDADQSICPAGWTLPKDGNQAGPGSFYNLVSSYGWDSNSKKLGNNLKVWESPLYFPPGGLGAGYLSYLGFSGYYWSSVVNSSDSAVSYSFFIDGDVSPTGGAERSLGLSVRCVVRQF